MTHTEWVRQGTRDRREWDLLNVRMYELTGAAIGVSGRLRPHELLWYQSWFLTSTPTGPYLYDRRVEINIELYPGGVLDGVFALEGIYRNSLQLWEDV